MSITSQYNTLVLFVFAFTTLLLLPFSASAHETHMYEINGATYKFVVGSLNEPVIVDDKTGASFEIIRNGTPLVGAQDSLQLEMSAGDKSRVVSLSPVHGAEGQYKSDFIATVPTTLTYRVYGTLEDTEVDLSFTCNPAGHPQSEEDTNRTEISDNVFQTLKRGSFGCPQPKEAFGFPEEAQSSFQMEQAVAEVAQSQSDSSAAQRPLTMGALALSVLACALAAFAINKK